MAYLQNGVLYRYELSTQRADHEKALNMTAFSWSARRQQFATVGNGHLLLLDERGLPPVDLSIHLKTLPADVEVESCDRRPPPLLTPMINLFDVVAWACHRCRVGCFR